jgi:hypothetical protein
MMKKLFTINKTFNNPSLLTHLSPQFNIMLYILTKMSNPLPCICNAGANKKKSRGGGAKHSTQARQRCRWQVTCKRGKAFATFGHKSRVEAQGITKETVS